MNSLLFLISSVVNILIYMIIAQVVLSLLIQFGIVNSYQPFVQTVNRALHGVTEPIYAPIRRIIPPLGGMDFSPLILILLMQFLVRLLYEYLYQF